MALLKPILKASNPIPGKNIREKVDPAGLFLPKALPDEVAAPAAAGDSGMNLGRARGRRASFNYGSGLSGGVR